MLGSEEIDGIQRRDDFATDQQFFQIVAVTELLSAEEADPKIRGAHFGFVGLDKRRRNEHADFLSTARATSGVTDGTRTRNSQNHNLELYH